MFFDVFESLCKERGVKKTTVCRECKVSPGAMDKWKKGSVPDTKTVAAFADYFGVSVDYLLGREQVAAYNGENLTAEAVKEIENFIEYIKNKYGV